MAGIKLFDYQREAVDQLRCGNILCGGVGSGKSRTALAYYYICCGGVLDTKNYVRMRSPKDLYIITTARKRDTLEWEKELLYFFMSTDPKASMYKTKVVIDSWNNIKKYADVKNSFFIFDEQRVVGYGAWTKSFLKISRGGNHWILLSATPGDTWSDYIPVFIANGFYKNKAEFVREHVVYSNYSKFHKNIVRNRWDPWNNEPMQNAASYCYALRRLVNSDESRVVAIGEIMESHPKVIIFYNFDYELDILKEFFRHLYHGVTVAEWNGHKHHPIPEGDSWAYLVQYTAGAEGWNCIKTDTIIFYSQNYSYKIMVQSSGRIDRLNTPYSDLYYYHLKSRSGIDLAISKALSNKKKFNEGKFAGSRF